MDKDKTPAPRLNEEAFVDYVESIWRDVVASRDPNFDAPASELIASIEAYILLGDDETQRVIDKAKLGDELCDNVLRRLWRDMIARWERPNDTLLAYGLTPPLKLKRKRGPRTESYSHNIELALNVAWVCEAFSLNPTRDQASLNEKLPPSGCSIMRAVLARCGDHRAESTIQNIYLNVERDIGRNSYAADGGLRGRARAQLSRWGKGRFPLIRPEIA
jgi:hypothetical protein